MKFSENLLAYTWTGIFSCFVIILIGPHNKANVALDRSIGKSARRSAEREDAGSNPGRTNTQGLQITLDRRKCCLCKEICKRLDFQIFWDKDGKPKARLTTLAKLNSDEIEKKSALFVWRVRSPVCCSMSLGGSDSHGRAVLGATHCGGYPAKNWQT